MPAQSAAYVPVLTGEVTIVGALPPTPVKPDASPLSKPLLKIIGSKFTVVVTFNDKAVEVEVNVWFSLIRSW